MRSTLVSMLCFAGMVLCGGDLHAQFTVPEAKPEIRLQNILPDTVRSLPSLENHFFNPAKERADRRRVRRDRNTVEFTSNIRLSQTQFENYASGGDNTFMAQGTAFLKHQYKRNRFGIDYTVNARYGMNHIDRRSFKNEDEFRFHVQTLWNIHNHWSYSATANLRSQFAKGFNSRTDRTLKSAFMSPGFLDLAVGFTYKNSPWNIVLSPVGGSAVFMLDDELSRRGINGVPVGAHSRWLVGPSVRIGLDTEFMKKICRVRSELYSFYSVRKPPTARWETTLDIRASKYLTTTLYWLAYYDRDANTPRRDQVQLKYSISVGFTYTFKNK